MARAVKQVPRDSNRFSTTSGEAHSASTHRSFLPPFVPRSEKPRDREQADEELNRLFFRRFSRLQAVRRFVAVWTVLVLLLGLGALWQVRGMDSFYLTTAPIDGGVYREGIIGTFTNANPLFATTSVDTSVSKLIFSGLFKISTRGEVVGDLADKVDVDSRVIIYTVTLRDGVYWQDGQKFSADDVVFTYKTMQNPAAR